MELEQLDIPARVRAELLLPNGFQPAQNATGGYSAAVVWRCAGADGDQGCLRRWPPAHPTPQRLKILHDHLQRLTARGIVYTPAIHCNHRGETFVCDGGHLWELTGWLPGSADYLQHPSVARLRSALTGLARVHHVWEESAREGVSPTLRDRLERLRAWQARLADEPLVASGFQCPVEQHLCHQTYSLLQQWLPRLIAETQAIVEHPVRLHFVQRDLWSAHVLFQGEELSGMIDFGAARFDEPWTDVVRLLGTCEPASVEPRRAGVQFYREARLRLGDVLHTSWTWVRFQLLDRIATLLSAAQWMEWLNAAPGDSRGPRQLLVERWSGFTTRMRQLVD